MLATAFGSVGAWNQTLHSTLRARETFTFTQRVNTSKCSSPIHDGSTAFCWRLVSSSSSSCCWPWPWSY